MVSLHMIGQIISHIIGIGGRGNCTNRTNNVFIIISMLRPERQILKVSSDYLIPKIGIVSVARDILEKTTSGKVTYVMCWLRSWALKPYWPHRGHVKESWDESPRRKRSLSDEVRIHFNCFISPKRNHFSY